MQNEIRLTPDRIPKPALHWGGDEAPASRRPHATPLDGQHGGHGDPTPRHAQPRGRRLVQRVAAELAKRRLALLGVDAHWRKSCKVG